MDKIQTKGHGGVFFWMQRVASEYRVKANELIKEADTLHWQTTEFENMPDEVKKSLSR